MWVTAQIPNRIFSRKCGWCLPKYKSNLYLIFPPPHLLLRLLIKPLDVFLAGIQVAVSRGLAWGGNTTARAPAGRA